MVGIVFVLVIQLCYDPEHIACITVEAYQPALLTIEECMQQAPIIVAHLASPNIWPGSWSCERRELDGGVPGRMIASLQKESGRK
jgi:hypothetical protein